MPGHGGASGEKSSAIHATVSLFDVGFKLGFGASAGATVFLGWLILAFKLLHWIVA